MPIQQNTETVQVVCPALGEGIMKAKVAYWHVRLGDAVRAGDDVVEVMTDKATFGIEADVSGVLKEICAEKGAEVQIGACLAVIEKKEQG